MNRQVLTYCLYFCCTVLHREECVSAKMVRLLRWHHESIVSSLDNYIPHSKNLNIFFCLLVIFILVFSASWFEHSAFWFLFIWPFGFGLPTLPTLHLNDRLFWKLNLNFRTCWNVPKGNDFWRKVAPKSNWEWWGIFTSFLIFLTPWNYR